jgi:neurofibromin 1
MSLVTATAFQISPVVQARSFVSLGALATSEVDDDFIYQIMVALKTSLTRVQDSCIITIVSMLRCLCKLAPALDDQSRYVPLFFWLGVSLLQAGHPSFFEEASSLLTTSLELMEKQGIFRQHTVPSVLLEYRLPLDSVTQQLDEILGISFDSSFSIALAHIIFKGVRHSALKDSAEAMLRCLLQVTVRSDRWGMTNGSNKYREVLCPEVLGYFLALLPFSSTAASYRRLLKEAGIDDAWHVDAGLPDPDRDDTSAPRLTTTFLNINDSHTALLVATVVGTMLGTAQGDDAETEMLYGLLAELAVSFPDIIYVV